MKLRFNVFKDNYYNKFLELILYRTISLPIEIVKTSYILQISLN